MEARPHGLLSGLGPPSQMADEGPDEDSLNREHQEPEGDESDLLAFLHRRLRSGSPVAIHVARGVAGLLIEMANSAEQHDTAALDHHYEQGMNMLECIPHVVAEHENNG